MKLESPKVLSLLPAFLFVAGAVGLACGSVSQSGDAGNGGAAGTTNGGAASAGASGGTAGSAGATHGSPDGGAGSAGSAGAHGGAGNGGSGGAHGGSDGGAGSGGAGKDGGVCICTEIYSPVCGVDGKDYANACNAACAGVAVAHTGGCVTAGDGGGDGAVPLDYCDQASDCETRPAGGCSCSRICVAKTDPVPQSPPFTCDIACPLIVVACGCVNHQCTAGAATAASP